MAQGFRNVRVQVGLPGMAGYGSQRKDANRPKALHDKPLFDPAAQIAARPEAARDLPSRTRR